MELPRLAALDNQAHKFYLEYETYAILLKAKGHSEIHANKMPDYFARAFCGAKKKEKKMREYLSKQFKQLPRGIDKENCLSQFRRANTYPMWPTIVALKIF